MAWCSQFSHKYSQNIPHTLPARYMVFFVDPASDWYSTSILVIIHIITYNSMLHYNHTHLYYLNQCWSSSLMPYGVTRLQWVNILRTDNKYMCQWTGSSLIQIIACQPLCCQGVTWTRLIVNWTHRNKSQWHRNRNNIHLMLASPRHQPLCSDLNVLTHIEAETNGCHIPDDIFKYIFLKV